MAEEETPEYGEWLKVEFKVRKSSEVPLQQAVKELVKVINGNFFNVKDVLVKGMATEYGFARQDQADAVPTGMWRVIYKDTPKGTIFDILGNIDLAKEVDLTAEVKQSD